MNKFYKEIRGIGVHNGETVILKIYHAGKGSGITFNIVEHPNGNSKHKVGMVKACPGNINDKEPNYTLNTKLVSKGVTVYTTEHLFSALNMLNIYDAYFEMDCDEVPILDGSASKFYDLMKEFSPSGNNPPEPFSITDTFRVEDENGAYIEVFPHNGFKIEFTIDFPGSVIGQQTFIFEQGKDDYAKEIASARTFGFIKYLPEIQKQGLALGSSLMNSLAVDFDGNSYINDSRFENEAVRHKILDLIGDMHIIGRPVKGFFKAYKASHSLNGQLVKKIASLM